MARKPREISKSGIYHVILRGNDKLIFTLSDCDELLSLFKKYLCTASCELYSYSIENDKINLLIKTDNFSNSIKPLCTSYARFCNRVYKTKGRLFYDRFISVPVKDYNEASDITLYIHSKKSLHNSHSEYAEKEILCNTKIFTEKELHNKIIKNENTHLFTDTYSKMSDSQLKEIIFNTYNINENSLKTIDIDSLINTILKTANISKSRLYSIFGISAQHDKSAKIISENRKTKPVKDKETPKVTKKKELSVWLL